MLATLGERFDLEKKFALWLFGLLVAGYAAHGLLEARGAPLVASMVVIGCVGAVASIVAHYIVFKPMRRIVAVAEAVGTGDFSKRLHLERHDEIGCLARAMDSMCIQLAIAKDAANQHIAGLEQLRHSDRIATLGRLASSVAHELGNPLHAIELRAELIGDDPTITLKQAKENAAAIVEQARRMTNIIEEVLSFARRHAAKIERFDLSSVLRKGIALCEHTTRNHGCRISLDVPSQGLEMEGDPDKLLQVVVNLLQNGAQAMPQGGLLIARLTEERASALHDPDGPKQPFVCIEVLDRGHGIAPELLSRVFDPFFSTRTAVGGTGLGLSVAQGIVAEHDGYIRVESRLGSGSSFKVYLPKHDVRGTKIHGS